jgi:hypothetical protein
MRHLPAALALMLVACSPAQNEQVGDTSTAVASIDTLKAAPGDSAGISTAARDTIPQVVPPGTAATKQQTTGTKTAPRDTTNIGRDRAIPLDTRDPKVYLPTVDTSKTKTRRPPR